MIAALLAMPYHAKADTNYHYYLVGDFNNYAVESNYKFGPDTRNQGTLSVSGPEVYPEETSLTMITNAKNNWADIEHVYDSTTGYYSWTITKEEVEAAMSGFETANRIEYKLHLGDSYYGLPSGSRDPGWSSWSVIMGTDGDTYKNAYFYYNSQILSYKIQAKYDDNHWYVRVIPKYSTWYLHSNLGNSNDWDGETNYPLSYNAETGFYQTTLDAATIQSAYNDDVRFRIYDIAKGSWGPTVNYQFNSTGRTGHIATALGVDPYYSIPKTYGDYNVTFAKIEAQYTDNMLVQVYVTLTMEAIEPHDYYWVSPQVTNGQKLPSFKMVASRNRSGEYGDGLISTKYFTFTMKDDDFRDYNGNPIAKGTTIQWYIVRDDNEVFYRPATELAYDNTPATYDDDHTGSGALDSYVNFKNYWNGASYAGAEAYKTTDATRAGSFAFRKGDHKSVTFNMNADKGHIFFNYVNTGYANPSTNSEFYLIGNFKSASETEYISISDETHPLTAKYYTNGVESETYTAQCDSVVYVTTVNKPGNGWGNLYLDVNLKGNTDWENVYRPLINIGNNLDGRALIGGIVKKSSSQSLNPETSDKYTSYEFRFNATTMTYRITFHTSMYLVGPGVSSTEGTGSWNISKVSSSDPRIRLNATQEVGHYRNRVYFTQDKEFRFIQNIDEADPDYKTTWHENGNAPKFRTATTDNEYTPGNETQYKNVLTFQNGTGSSTDTTPSGTSVTFDLPTGWYYVNFYENSGNPYYTIERQIELRDFENVKYSNGGIEEDRHILNRGGYNFFRVWSDHIAWTKPADIDVFVVTNFSIDQNGQATAVLTKQNVDYIPANTGVILASTETKSSFGGGIVYKEALSGTSYNTAWMDMTPYDAPATTYNGVSKLTPLYDATNLQRFVTEDNTDYANYLFGFYRLNKVIPNYTGYNNDFGLGFWITTGVGDTYPNSAFLRILKSDAEKMGVGTKYDMTGVNHAPVLYLMFEDASASEYTTGIRNDRVQNVSSDEWFTLEGRRVASPTGKGLYIHNGKKVVIR